MIRRARFLVLLVACAAAWSDSLPVQKITINFATRTGTSWPLYIAKVGGYFQKYGLDVKMAFAVHPAGVAMIVSGEAAMTNYPLEQAMIAASKDGSLVILGSPFRKSLFELMGAKNLSTVRDLKGKRIGVSQIGDAPYNYTVALLGKSGWTAKDVQWVPSGPDVNSRALFLTTGRADATLLTAPAYFKVETQGFKNIAYLADYNDIYASSVYLFTKKTITANPKLPELIIKAQAEAIRRFYGDKDFAIKAYLETMKADKPDPMEIDRVYDLYAKSSAFERVPYVLTGAVKSVVDQADSQTATAMKTFDFKTVVDNSTVDRLVKEGFFQTLFGNGIKSEEERKSKLALR